MSNSNGYEVFTCSSLDGLRLSARKYGWQNRDDYPIVCLAGITRNASDFHELAMYLASEVGGNRRILAIDYRGRGLSEYDRNWKNYSLAVETEDVLNVITAAGLGAVNLIGSSRGGLIAMMIATMRPGILKSVILNDIGPVIDATGFVRIRNTYETRNLPASMEEAAELRERIGHRSSPAFTAQEWMLEAKRLYRLENGKMTLQFDVKLLKNLRAINLDVRLPDMWPGFIALKNIPVMSIRAENTDILSLETLEAMKQSHPRMKTIMAHGQSHAPILSVGGLEKEISGFLNI